MIERRVIIIYSDELVNRLLSYYVMDISYYFIVLPIQVIFFFLDFLFFYFDKL